MPEKDTLTAEASAARDLEMAAEYLQAPRPKDDAISEELCLALCLFAGEAGKKGDWETYDLVMDRLPVDVENFLELLDLYPKEELAEYVKDMNMSEVIKVLGKEYMRFEWPSGSKLAQ